MKDEKFIRPRIKPKTFNKLKALRAFYFSDTKTWYDFFDKLIDDYERLANGK